MIQIIELLTQKVWNYVDNVLPTNPFVFNGSQWPSGDYILKNMSGVNVSVVLFGQSYTVPAHTNWEFMAHRQLETVSTVSGGKGVGKPRSVNLGETAVGADGTSATAAPGTTARLPPEQVSPSPTTGARPAAGSAGLGAAHGGGPHRGGPAERAGPPTPSGRRR
jgi:hypothetical protein